MRKPGATARPQKGSEKECKKQFIETEIAICIATLNLSRLTNSMRPITINDSTTGAKTNGPTTVSSTVLVL